MTDTVAPRPASRTSRAARRTTPAARRNRRRTAADAGLLVAAAAFVLPLAWVVLSALDPHASLRVKVPDGVTLDNFDAILTPEITFTPLLNSLILCGGATLLTVVCAVLAAYPLSRFRSRLNRPFLLTILFATSLPITAIMVPVYALFVRVNMIDTMQGTIFFFAASQLPFAIWLMKNFMDGVPKELEEAAWTDGASSFQSLLRIVLPLMGPGVAVVTVFSFVMMWGNFFVPFMLLLSPDQMPASVSINDFFGNRGMVAYGQLAAFSIVYSTPVVLLYVLISRRLGGGFALGGAVKGRSRGVGRGRTRVRAPPYVPTIRIAGRTARSQHRRGPLRCGACADPHPARASRALRSTPSPPAGCVPPSTWDPSTSPTAYGSRTGCRTSPPTSSSPGSGGPPCPRGRS